MSQLDALIELKRLYEIQLSNKRAEKQGYLNKANEIQAIYNNMSSDKSLIEGYRDNIKAIRDTEHENFKGNLYTQKYLDKVEALFADYDTVVTNIGTNMDSLNDARTQYVTKANNCNSTITSLESSISYFERMIQNLS